MSAEGAASPPESRPRAPAAGPILVVEDDAHLAGLVSAALLDLGLDVLTAGDGPEALRLAAAGRPALVVLDWALPGATGATVAAGLRELHGGDLPILLVTAVADPYPKAEAVGAYTCLLKPFDLAHLHAAVLAGLARREPG
jgi:DNA-binding response OmpR family regulator